MGITAKRRHESQSYFEWIWSNYMLSWILSVLSGSQPIPDEKMLMVLGSVPREGRSEPTE